jgi:hypothetical protein
VVSGGIDNGIRFRVIDRVFDRRSVEGRGGVDIKVEETEGRSLASSVPWASFGYHLITEFLKLVN